ncbi:MAG: hypothetical protein ACI9X0_001476, partial [Kiritimatiellia bacterium]
MDPEDGTSVCTAIGCLGCQFSFYIIQSPPGCFA